MIHSLITIGAISAVGNIMGYISHDEDTKDLINIIATTLTVTIVATIILPNVILILKSIR